MRQLLLSAALIALLALPAAADLITSTAGGGIWSNGSTWVGGVVPAADDDVLLVGPVQVHTTAACRDLHLSASGELADANPGATLLSASGDVLNEGTIDEALYLLTLEVGGDITNAGIWRPAETVLTGTVDRAYAMTETAIFDSNLSLAADASGDLLINAPIRLRGVIDVRGGRMLLQGHAPFTLDEAVFHGELLAYGNSLIFESWSYLQFATLDQVVLVGEVEIAAGVQFTGGLTVMDVMQNSSSSGGAHAVIHGDLVNHGIIRNNTSYGFTISLYGDLVNNGLIDNSHVAFQGATTHHISASGDAVIGTSLFLPEFEVAMFVVDTPLHFSGGGIGLGIGSMILEPGSNLTFDGHGGLGGSFGEGDVLANGNSIRLGEYGAILGADLDDAVLEGYVALGDDNRFTSGVTVADTLVNRAHNVVTAEIEGLLLNEDLITENGGSFTISLLGDAENRGSWSNSLVRVAGTTDQAIGAGAGIDVPEFVLVADFEAAGYQWTRNGDALPGETGSELTLNTVGAADYGVYRCEGDQGELSRVITIAEFVDPTDATPVVAGTALAQNHPNPFNPATEIRFILEDTGPVSLTVYDVTGRAVDQLVDRVLTAGEHRVEWRPEGLSSGIYFYRLETAGEERIRKATLLK